MWLLLQAVVIIWDPLAYTTVRTLQTEQCTHWPTAEWITRLQCGNPWKEWMMGKGLEHLTSASARHSLPPRFRQFAIHFRLFTLAQEGTHLSWVAVWTWCLCIVPVQSKHTAQPPLFFTQLIEQRFEIRSLRELSWRAQRRVYPPCMYLCMYVCIKF